MRTAVTEVDAAPADLAKTHFAAKLSFETDCWDVHEALQRGADFVLLDVRGTGAFDEAHVDGAISLPHRKISAEALAGFPPDCLFVVYCAGPHCNGADKAGLRLSRLGRAVKIMIGGIAGWRDEGFALTMVSTPS